MFPRSFTLETKRLKLRMPSSEDIPFVFSATRFPGFNDGMLWEPPAHPDELIEPLENSIEAWVTGKAYTFTVENKLSNDFLGRISIRPTQTEAVWNVGFFTHPEQQGKGIMSEALAAVLAFGFTQLSATRIEACHALWNKASEKVLQKNGMQFVRYIREGFQKKGQWVEENLLAIDREDWQKAQDQARLLEKIVAKGQHGDLFKWLTRDLTGSELNSLLLAVFNERVSAIRPADLLRNYRQNRFVDPAPMDVISFAEFELKVLKYVQSLGFELFEAGPVSPLGTCSVMGPVDQKKVISALRNTEVVADVTNVMALEIAKRKQADPGSGPIHLSAVHRHIRAQFFDLPSFTAHFKIISLVSAARDTGDCGFEVEALTRHINGYAGLLREVFKLAPGQLSFRGIYLEGPETGASTSVWERVAARISIGQVSIASLPQGSNEYYRGFQFKIVLEQGGQAYEIIDGGRVDWMQKLLGNRKERMVISGLGLEFLYKLLRK